MQKVQAQMLMLLTKTPNNNLTCYQNDRFWDVTEKFMFPKNMLLNNGWIAWLKWVSENRECTNEITAIILVKPLRLMNANLLPKKLFNNLLNEISPMMSLMEDAPEIQMNQNAIIDENFRDKSFDYVLNNAKRTTQHMLSKEN